MHLNDFATKPSKGFHHDARFAALIAGLNADGSSGTESQADRRAGVGIPRPHLSEIAYTGSP
jgi:hypothetical protein